MGKKSKTGHNQQKSQPKQAVIQPQQRKGILRWLLVLSPTGWLCASISLVLALVGSYYLLRPPISVEPDMAIDTNQPMTTPFRITNCGQLPLYDVRRQCVVHSLKNESGDISVDGPLLSYNSFPPIKKLDAGEATSVFIPLAITPETPFTSGDIEVVVEYSTAIIKTRQERHFRFATRRDTNKEVRWYHKASSE